MNKQKKQNILTTIIIVSVLALIMLVGSAVYEELININKGKQQEVSAPIEGNKELDKNEEKEEDKKEEVEEEPVEDKKEPEEEYIGEEEKEVEKEENTTKSKDEKAIDLAKKEWGEDDTVTFNVEEKKGNIYYVAVKSNAVTITWYEVNTETWEISEYY